MARRLISRVVRMRGGATLGFGARVRIYDDEALTVLSAVYRRATGVGTQPNPLLPNAGMQTALTVNGGSGDTTITVASTAGFQVGDLIPIRNTTTFRYRVITAINPGTGVITLDSALGAAFNLTDTTIGGPEMRGHIWLWVETVLDPFMEVEDIASGRFSPPLQLGVSLPGAVVGAKEQTNSLGVFSVLTFLGTAITAVDAGAGELQVTVGGDFSDQAFIRIGANTADGGLLRVPNTGYMVSRNFANSSNLTVIGVNASNQIWIDANASGTLIGGTVTVSGAFVSVGTTPAASGTVRIPNNAAIDARNAGNTTDIDLIKLTAADVIQIGNTGATVINLASAGGVTVGSGPLTVNGTSVLRGLVAVKAADEDVTSSTVLQNDDHLSFAVGAGERWAFEMFLKFEDTAVGSGASGFKIAFTLPAASYGFATWETSNVGSANAIADITVGTNIGFAGTNGIGYSTVRGVVLVAGTAGTVQFQWAQNASDTAPTRLHAGSWLVATRVA